VEPYGNGMKGILEAYQRWKKRRMMKLGKRYQKGVRGYQADMLRYWCPGCDETLSGDPAWVVEKGDDGGYSQTYFCYYCGLCAKEAQLVW